MINKARFLGRAKERAKKLGQYIGIAVIAYAGYAGFVYVAWAAIKPSAGLTACRNICANGMCGCGYWDTLYNETIMLAGQNPSWVVLPFLGQVFPGLS